METRNAGRGTAITRLLERLRHSRFRPKKVLPWLLIVVLFMAAGGFWVFRRYQLERLAQPEGLLTRQSLPQLDHLRRQVLLTGVRARLASLRAEADAKRDLSALARDYRQLEAALVRLYGNDAAWVELEPQLDELEEQLRDNNRGAVGTLDGIIAQLGSPPER